MAGSKKADELIVSLKNGKLYLGKKAAEIIKEKNHLCGDCLRPYSQCPKMSRQWQPIEYYGWITEGSQKFIEGELTYRLSPEEQMDLFDTGKYDDVQKVPDREKVSAMIPDTFVVTGCQRFVAPTVEATRREQAEKDRIMSLKKR